MVEKYGGNAIAGANASDHYLQLDNNEKALLDMVCKSFNKVVVLLNTSSTMELGDLENNNKINAILWMGLPGQTGAAVIGDLLDGTINPSGRTTDTYVRDFNTIPAGYNFSDNKATDGNRYTINGTGRNAYFVDYEEGIYVGYRYYETRGYTDGETWYKNNVVYPFGYGLSYTQFKWTVKSISKTNNSELNKDDKITVEVEVENTGECPGKDVVELYYKVPYYTGGIEKSYIQLGAFAKTQTIEPGKSDTVTLEMSVEDMKSYDYSGIKVDGGGYILEKGDYSIVIANNIHETPVAQYKYTVSNDIRYDEGSVTNQFSDVSEHITTYLSRANWDETMPTTPTEEDREVTAAWLQGIAYSANDTEASPWYSATIPTSGSTDESVQFKDLKGLDYDDAKWDEFMDRLTYEDMANLIGVGAFGTIQLENYSIPSTYHEDGPAGFANFMDKTKSVVYSVCNYAAECVVGATWNVDLAYEMGKMIGNEGLIGNTTLPYSGWYGPAVNIHRTPFGGRNWEYYSEDGYISGVMASAVIKGCNEKGVYVFMKHFAVNEQETDRSNNGLIVWTNEQALREIYLKPFEIALKNNDKAGVMSSFTRIGFTWTGGSYNLLTNVLRKEWGVNCAVITDYAIQKSYMNVNQMIRAGGDLALTQDSSKIPSTSNITATQATSIRRAAKNILYAIVNSNAMDAEIIGYKMPIWEMTLIIVDCVVFVALAVWGYFAIRSAFKKENQMKDE
jgi:beta-glucosidase